MAWIGLEFAWCSCALLLHRIPTRQDCLDDVVIAGAATEVAFQPLSRLMFVGRGTGFNQLDGTHDHPRCAEAALEGMVLMKGLLHRVEFAALGQPLDGCDGGSIGFDRQHGAALHGTTVDVNDAGPAVAGIAADVGSGELQFVAKQLNEECSRLDLDRDWLPVHLQRDPNHGSSKLVP